MNKKIRKLIQEELNKIYLSERLGVPDNLINVSTELYNLLLTDINKLSNSELEYFNQNTGGDSSFSTYIINKRYPGKFKISDYFFNLINFKIQLTVIPHLDDTAFIGMTFSQNTRVDFKKMSVNADFDSNPGAEVVNLSINVGFKEETETLIDELKDYFVSDKDRIIGSISHELKHAYDKYKKTSEKMSSIADYRSAIDLRFSIKEVDEFLHYIYFVHLTENLVRPSELAGEMESGNIDKKGFIDFLKSNETYNYLIKIKNFSYADFKNKLLSNVNQIRNVLVNNVKGGKESIDNLNDEQVVEFLLKIILSNIANVRHSILFSMLTENDIEMFMGYLKTDAKNKYLEKYMNNLRRFIGNHDKFFENEEKNFKFVATNIIKKIHKLYDMLEDKDKVDNINSKINKKVDNSKEIQEEVESIKDWDAYKDSVGIKGPNFKITDLDF